MKAIEFYKISGSGNDAVATGTIEFVSGNFGQSLNLTGTSYLIVECTDTQKEQDTFWNNLTAKFSDEVSIKEIKGERQDNIWGTDWKNGQYCEIAGRYANAAERPEEISDQISTHKKGT